MAAYGTENESFSFDFLEEQSHLNLDHSSNVRVNKIFQVTRPQAIKSQNRCIGVLVFDEITHSLTCNPQFQEYLVSDSSDATVSFVTVFGSKQIGKSFLVDCLISKEEGAVTRSMSKQTKQMVNAPSQRLHGRSRESIVLLDCDGDLTNQAFLWCYFMSSTMVINLNSLDHPSQEAFLSKLAYVSRSLTSRPQVLTLPQLIIIRRDTLPSELQPSNFIARVEDMELLQIEIISLAMPNPGSKNVKTKEIVDVAPNLLTKNYLGQLENLLSILKATKPKAIHGNMFGSKIAAILSDSLTKAINKKGSVQTVKIWEDVIETVSVNYYNFCNSKHSLELESVFNDERPVDNYTLYKRFSSARRLVLQKTQSFNSLSSDPIFEKYEEKIKLAITNKEKMIASINKAKASEANKELCRNSFNSLKEGNYDKCFDSLATFPLSDGKCSAFLTYFAKYCEAKNIEIKAARSSKKLPHQVTELDQELAKLEREIQLQKQFQKSSIIDVADLSRLRLKIESNQKEIAALEKELHQARSTTSIQRNIEVTRMNALQSEIRELEIRKKQSEERLSKLNEVREKESQKQVYILSEKIKQEQEKNKKMQAALKRLQQKNAQDTSLEKGDKVSGRQLEGPEGVKRKDTTCCVIV